MFLELNKIMKKGELPPDECKKIKSELNRSGYLLMSEHIFFNLNKVGEYFEFEVDNVNSFKSAFYLSKSKVMERKNKSYSIRHADTNLPVKVGESCKAVIRVVLTENRNHYGNL